MSTQVHAYLFLSLPLLVVRSSNLVHILSLITNNYFYLSNRREIKNETENIPGIDQIEERAFEDWIDFALMKGSK